MDVDNPALVAEDDVGAEDAHVAGQHHPDRPIDGLGELVANVNEDEAEAEADD